MFPRIFVGVAIVSASLVGVPRASAEIRSLATTGVWTAYGGTGDDNRALCGLSTAGAETRRIAIQQYAGETGLELRLVKESWVIPTNTRVDIQFQFDGAPPIPMQAVGADRTLVVALTFEQSMPFMRSVRAGRQIRVIFQAGDELPWVGGLTGSARIINAFNACRGGLAPAVASQPFAVPAPSTQTRP